ncbi:S-methyl-5-thioribose-1-phosphate isomerase, partial [Neobacillus drentensis]
MENTYLQSVSYENGVLKILDQTKIPNITEFLETRKIEDAWDAIKQLKVRGAPAIGIAAAYGLVLGIKDAPENSFEDFYAHLKKQSDYLGSSRPTAVNLFWALKRMNERALKDKDLPVKQIKEALENEANTIRNEDEDVCRTIGEHALNLLADGMGILTHCNAGGIATARYGTALAPLYLAKEKG